MPTAREAAAVRQFGPRITDPSLLMFAKLVADGVTERKAYSMLRPKAEENEVNQMAARLRDHPHIRVLVATHRFGMQSVARSAAPAALQKLIELSDGQHGATAAIQAKAADSILDRSGLPRTTQILADIKSDVAQSVDSLILEGEVVDEEPKAEENAILRRRSPSSAQDAQDGPLPPGLDEGSA